MALINLEVYIYTAINKVVMEFAFIMMVVHVLLLMVILLIKDLNFPFMMLRL